MCSVMGYVTLTVFSILVALHQFGKFFFVRKYITIAVIGTAHKKHTLPKTHKQFPKTNGACTKHTIYGIVYMYKFVWYVCHHYHLENLFSFWIVEFSLYFCCCRSETNDSKKHRSAKFSFSHSLFLSLSCIHTFY